jgi:hypothetical protein
MTVSGDIEAIFSALKTALIEIGFKELSSFPPNKLELQRGKGGLLTTRIQDCKTDLKVSLKESPTSEIVDILFDYTFDIPGIFTDGDRKAIEGELMKIKHKLFDVSPSGTPKFFRAFSEGRNNKPI